MNCLVITGASAGIGLATARRFLAAGFRVVNISRRPCPAQGVVQLTADLGDPASVTAIRASLDAAVTGATRLVVIHNAARMLSDTAAFTDDAALRAAVQDTAVFARVSPEHKLRIVRALKAEGWRVIVGATARAVTVRFIELLTAPRLLVMVTVQRPELAIATLLKVHWAVLTPWTMPSRDHR